MSFSSHQPEIATFMLQYKKRFCNEPIKRGFPQPNNFSILHSPKVWQGPNCFICTSSKCLSLPVFQPVLVSPVSPSPGQGMPWEHQVTHQTQIPHSPHVINPGWAGCLVYLSLDMTPNGYQSSFLPVRLVIFSQFLLFNKKLPTNSCRKQPQVSLLIPKILEKWCPGLCPGSEAIMRE